MKKQKRNPSEPLRRVRHAKALLRLTQIMAVASFGAAVFCFYRAQYREGWFLVALTFLVTVLLALPAAGNYRSQWKYQSIQAGYGRTSDGYNCSGGVCRYVPSQRGFTLSYNYNF